MRTLKQKWFQKKLNLMIFAFIIIVGNSMDALSATNNIITIDGDLSDWKHLDPVISNEPENESYDLFLQKGFITVNESHFFILVEYNKSYTEEGDIFTNVTIQNPIGECYVIMAWADHRETEWGKMTSVLKGLGINSPYHIADDPFISIHEGTKWAQLDKILNNSIEFTVPLNELNLSYDSVINATFWHFDIVSAGSVSMFQPISAGTVINYRLSINEQTGIMTTDRQTGIMTTDRSSTTDIIPAFDFFTIITTLILMILFLNSKNY